MNRKEELEIAARVMRDFVTRDGGDDADDVLYDINVEIKRLQAIEEAKAKRDAKIEAMCEIYWDGAWEAHNPARRVVVWQTAAEHHKKEARERMAAVLESLENSGLD